MDKRFKISDIRFVGSPQFCWRFLDAGAAGAGSAGGAAPAGAAALPPPLIGADGKLAENWQSSLPEDLRADKTLAVIKDLPSMAGMIVNSQKIIGKLSNNRNFALLPEGPQDTAGADVYFEKAGWPKDKGPDAYPKLDPLPNTPQGVEADPETDKQWRSWCHKHRLTADQFVALTREMQAWQIADYNLRQADRAKKLEEGKAELQRDWQSQHPFRVQRAGTALAAATAGTPGLMERATEKGWIEDPDFLRIMDWVGQNISPDRLHLDSGGRPDKSGIESQIEQLETSNEYRDPKNPRHESVTARVLELRRQLLAAG